MAGKTSDCERWLCTTGASDQNSSLNIYDFEGNLYEWTLQWVYISYSPCVFRGGSFYNSEYASHGYSIKTNHSNYNVSARVSLFI